MTNDKPQQSMLIWTTIHHPPLLLLLHDVQGRFPGFRRCAFNIRDFQNNDHNGDRNEMKSKFDCSEPPACQS